MESPTQLGQAILEGAADLSNTVAVLCAGRRRCRPRAGHEPQACWEDRLIASDRNSHRLRYACVSPEEIPEACRPTQSIADQRAHMDMAGSVTRTIALGYIDPVEKGGVAEGRATSLGRGRACGRRTNGRLP